MTFSDKLNSIVFRILVALGTLIMVLGLTIAYYTLASIREKSVTVQATIVGFHDSGEGTFAPKCGYKDDLGRDYIFQFNSYTSPPAYQNGDKITLHYNPDKPYEAWIPFFMLDWFVPSLFTGIGVGLIGIGFLVNWYQNKVVTHEEENLI